ncbi:hypothetical protein D3C80_1837190 [compost metagenome]
MGIARILYEMLNEYLTHEDVLVSTDLSENGKNAELNVLRRQIVRKCKEMYDNRAEFLNRIQI